MNMLRGLGLSGYTLRAAPTNGCELLLRWNKKYNLRSLCHWKQQEGKGLAIVIKPQDLSPSLEKKRIGCISAFRGGCEYGLAARHRMEATKAAILSLLRDSYIPP